LADAGGWFVLREKYCWLVADKPNEHGEYYLVIMDFRKQCLALLCGRRPIE
jgi:hypothetical protein